MIADFIDGEHLRILDALLDWSIDIDSMLVFLRIIFLHLYAEASNFTKEARSIRSSFLLWYPIDSDWRLIPAIWMFAIILGRLGDPF